MEMYVRILQVTCFSNSEEKVVGSESIVPWCPEDKLMEHGADFSKAEDWAPYVVQDGNLITGQNPKSSEAVAEKVINALGA
jgi:putative intracellular protease/amidase